MPNQATGERPRRNGAGTWTVRVTLRGKDRVTLELPHARSEDEAEKRARVLADVARRLRLARVEREPACKALEQAASAAPRSLHHVLAVVAELAGGELRPATTEEVPTFAEIARQWTSGELHGSHPDHVKLKRSAADDAIRLRLHILPHIGAIPVDRVTREDCKRVMAALPTKMAVATRRNVGQLMTRIFGMCVWPLELIEHSPLPPKFLPRAPEQAQHAFLYPAEDARLMAHRACPLAYRVLWGVLTREGMRLGEALALRWSQLDLGVGTIRLGLTKSDKGRFWALDPGVIAALRAYRKLREPVGPLDRVFVGPDGDVIVKNGALGLPALLRRYLGEVGVDRPELFDSAEDGSTRKLRCHDLRASFVTVSLANGRSEAWIAARTGHKSSQMINRYRRAAATFAELNLGAFAQLNAAIPELMAPGSPTTTANYSELLASPPGFEPGSPP